MSRHAKEDAERKEREERIKRQEEVRLKRKVSTALHIFFETLQQNVCFSSQCGALVTGLIVRCSMCGLTLAQQAELEKAAAEEKAAKAAHEEEERKRKAAKHQVRGAFLGLSTFKHC